MAITAGVLFSLLNDKADLAFCTAEQIKWSSWYDANAKKLQVQVKAEQKWEEACDKAIDNENDITYTRNGQKITIKAGNTNQKIADEYAHWKAQAYDEKVKLDLEEKDMEYDNMKTLYETMITKLQADIQSKQQLLGTNAQDTGLLGQ